LKGDLRQQASDGVNSELVGTIGRLFYQNTDITAIDGSLVNLMGGGTFTLEPSNKGWFEQVLDDCTNLAYIPPELFSGVSGDASETFSMFDAAFGGCTALTSIPEGIFHCVSGTLGSDMFLATFSGCTGLTSIPARLFSSISGATKQDMFSQTFYGCTGLTSIPAGLFSGITGPSATAAFDGIFDGCPWPVPDGCIPSF
jgi:hypothetical protein